MISMPKQNQRKISYFWMMINTIVWGAAFIAVKPAFEVITPIRFLLYRYIVAVLISLPILWHYRKKIKNIIPKIPALIGIELLGTSLALLLIYLGLEKTTAIEANLITTTLPLFITIGGVLFLKEKEQKNEAIGLIISLIGTVLLISIPLFSNGQNLQTISLTGNILILLGIIVDMAYYLLAKKYYKKQPMFLITTLSFYVGLLTFLPLALAETNFSISQLTQQVILDIQHPSVWIASIYMALFGSIIGLTAYYKGQDGIEASEASLFTYLQPFVAVPLGILFLNETISLMQLLALGLIFAGVYVAERRGK